MRRQPSLEQARAVVAARLARRRKREKTLKQWGILPTRLSKSRAKRVKIDKAKSLRASVRGRDGQQCQCCHIPVLVEATNPAQRAHVHHIRFRSQGGKDESKNLITLCADCHARVHRHTIKVIGTHALNIRFVKPEAR